MDAGAGSGERRELARRMIRRQSRLSLRLAAVFVVTLVALPLVNLYAPSVAGTRVGGFTLSWLLLAVLFYPFTVLLSALFVRGSDRIESEIVASERGSGEAGNRERGTGNSGAGHGGGASTVGSPFPVPGSLPPQDDSPSEGRP